VLGFDDKHLDFRVSVTVAPAGTAGTLVTVSTVVKTNNLPGRTYLAAIMPFHRIIVRHLLEHARFDRAA
jgi:cysteine synthase